MYMSKEEFIEKWNVAYLDLEEKHIQSIQMSNDLDALKEKVAVAFSNWRQEYVNELTHEYMIYTKGSEPAILVNDESDLYQYFINNVYNK